MIEPGEYGMGLLVTNEAARVQMFYDRDTGAFSHGWYRVVARPDQLARLGIAKLTKRTQTGVTPSGKRGANGCVIIEGFAKRVIPRDVKFCAAMAKVLDGSPLPDFGFPRPERRP